LAPISSRNFCSVNPCPLNRFEPPMIEGVRVFPPSREPTTNPGQITPQRRTGKIINRNGLRNIELFESLAFCLS